MNGRKMVELVKPLIVEAVVTVLGIVILALLMYQMEWGRERIQTGIWVIYGLACFVGGIAAGKVGERRKFIRGLCYGAVYFAALCFLSLAGGRQLEADTTGVLLSFLVCAACGMAGGMILQLRG
ncbi:MAG: TIGR04086 family membrane protein [Lachnospiraceae bacterium]|nr:TIGR04086 family membrane protein [Lachnospiraceae bacterium]MDD3797294.1 TIGR04086 family membrane protein [Lachnospiraceae bacterium]